MKLPFLFIVSGIGLFLLYILSQQSSKQVPSIRTTPTPNSQPQNSDSLPLTLPSGFSVSIFAKTPPSPRDLETDNEKTIFVSIPRQGIVLALIKEDSGNLQTKTIISSLNQPHGLTYFNNKLFVAEVDKVSRYDWNKETFIATREKVLFSLPRGGRHYTRSLIFDKNNNLLVSVGSTCDVCFENDARNGTILISDFEGNNPKIYASGLRNSVFMTRNPFTNEIWATEMGRDNLGDHTPPDEINIIKEADYGWPICYGQNMYDNDFAAQAGLSSNNSSACSGKTSPFIEIPAHSAPLGLVFLNHPSLPQEFNEHLLVAYHGSWNSTQIRGYKVVAIDPETKKTTDFITNFYRQGEAESRPVDLLLDRNGTVYLSDDHSNQIYQITYHR